MTAKEQITIFGASGRLGRVLVESALTEGFRVVGVVHSHSNLPDNPHLRIIKADVHNVASVREAIKGSTVVLSALSSWGTPNKDVLASGMANIITVMQDAGITRVISLTGADARASGDDLSIIHRMTHATIGIIGGKVLADAERHIRLLEESGLDWTVVRSPIIKSGIRNSYILADTRPMPWATVTRQAVAAAIVDLITSERYLHQTPYVRQS